MALEEDRVSRVVEAIQGGLCSLETIRRQHEIYSRLCDNAPNPNPNHKALVAYMRDFGSEVLARL